MLGILLLLASLLVAGVILLLLLPKVSEKDSYDHDERFKDIPSSKGGMKPMMRIIVSSWILIFFGLFLLSKAAISTYGIPLIEGLVLICCGIGIRFKREGFRIATILLSLLGIIRVIYDVIIFAVWYHRLYRINILSIKILVFVGFLFILFTLINKGIKAKFS